MIKKTIEKIISNENLSIEEAFSVMESILTGDVNHSQLSSLLTALKMKGETPIEIAGFVSAMKKHSVKINSDVNSTIDVCGTGGDFSNSINISTAVSFVVAGAGIKVAKHGNRSITSKAGSADVLEQMGINIHLSPEESEKALQAIGITFLFAQDYHPSMKYATPVRKELGFRTVFNILGPLTNPAGVTKQLTGTFNDFTAELMCSASQHLGYDRICFICSDNQFDEISLSGNTRVYEYDSLKGITNYIITNESFDYPSFSFDELRGNGAEYNSGRIIELLNQKKKDAFYYTVSANAAMALYASKYSENLITCIKAAEDSINSGAAFDKYLQLKNFGN
jgi:anthranilate phosphoribosyltransferase